MQPGRFIHRNSNRLFQLARSRLWLGFAGIFLWCQVSLANEQQRPVEFEITPYLWAATIDGTLAAGGDESPPIDSDYNFFSLDNLDGVASATFSARGKQWGFLFDFLYVAYEDVLLEGRILQVKPRLEGRILELAATYQPASIDTLLLIGGLRRQDIEIELTYLNRAPSASADWIDPFAGIVYSAALASRLDLSLRGDIGGFGIESDHALNAEAMLRYRFGRMFSLKFGYRYLKVEFQDNDLVYDASLAGFLLGLGIRF